MKMIDVNNVDEYIALFPAKTQVLLIKMRTVVIKLIPNVEETIRYGMPTYRLDTNLIHFAAYKSHIGFYPTPSVIDSFKKEIKKYKWSKGAIQFPLSEPIPYSLITEMTKYRVAECHLQKKQKETSNAKKRSTQKVKEKSKTKSKPK